MNPVLQFVPRCEPDDQYEQARAVHSRVIDQVEAIERLAGGLIEFKVPAPSIIALSEELHDATTFDVSVDLKIDLVLSPKLTSADLHDDLAAYSVRELRAVAEAATAAANRIEAAGIGGAV